jgi:hypothetical protein
MHLRTVRMECPECLPTLLNPLAVWAGMLLRKPEIHTWVDPESGSTQEALIEIFSQTAGSTCEFGANAVNFTLQVRVRAGRGGRADDVDHPGAGHG